MTIAEEMVPVAIELIDEEGREVTFEKPSTNNPSVNTHRGPTGPSDTVTQKAVFLSYGVDEIAGDRTLMSSKRLLTAHISDSLDGYKGILDGDVNWKIISIDVIKPGSTPVMYEMRVEI